MNRIGVPAKPSPPESAARMDTPWVLPDSGQRGMRIPVNLVTQSDNMRTETSYVEQKGIVIVAGSSAQQPHVCR